MYVADRVVTAFGNFAHRCRGIKAALGSLRADGGQKPDVFSLSAPYEGLQQMADNTLTGWQKHLPLTTALQTQAITVASGALGLPAGCVLHLTADNGTIKADYRKAGADKPSGTLTARKPPEVPELDPSKYQIAAFNLPNGNNLTVYQGPSIIDPNAKDVCFKVSVTRPDKLLLGTYWRDNGITNSVHMKDTRQRLSFPGLRCVDLPF